MTVYYDNPPSFELIWVKGPRLFDDEGKYLPDIDGSSWSACTQKLPYEGDAEINYYLQKPVIQSS